MRVIFMLKVSLEISIIIDEKAPKRGVGKDNRALMDTNQQPLLMELEKQNTIMR